MTRRRGPLVLAFVVIVTASWSAGAAPRVAPIINRSFSIVAEAFPEAPVPGRGGTELGPKPLASRAVVSNAPASAYGRAAASDNGTIELYTGPPPPETVAECDTTSTNIPDEAESRPGGAHLTAGCTSAPAAVATANGALADSSGGGSGSSYASGDGGGDAATASSIATVNDYTSGPIHIGSARYEAAAHTDGTVAGAAGTGRVSASDATVNGIPVVIGPDGVAVDESKVPAELVDATTTAVHDALGQGGYLNVRVAQPEVTVSPDGSTVVVRGGGVFFEARSNDPAQPYFVRQTLVGGALTVAVGADLGDPVTEPPAEGPGEIDTGAGAGPTGPTASPSGPTGDATAAPGVIPQLLARRSVHRTSPFGLGWVWIVVLAAVVAIACVAFRRWIEPRWNAIADRYVRG